MFYKEKEWRSLLNGKSILIAGYGREGRSTESFLLRFIPSTQIVVADGNDAIRSQAAKFDYIVKSPGIPSSVFEDCCDMSHITSQTDLFLRIYGSQTIGITGTKGKSTTTELIYSMLIRGLEGAVSNCVGKSRSTSSDVLKAGNMGIPLFDIIPILSSSSIVVAELSCHQLEHIKVAPHVGVLLNLYQEHLDHYHSYLDYQMAKMNIGLKQSADDLFFYCADNFSLLHLVESCRAKFKGKCIPYHCPPGDSMVYSSSLMGDHNRSNFMVASCVANYYGVSSECVEEVGRNFKGLHHRMERVGTYNGITFYNDSISTIPEATMAAVSSLPNVQTLILGGFDRGIDYTALAEFLVYSQLKNIVFVGAAGSRIYHLYNDLVKKAYMPRQCLLSNDYVAIVDWCYEHTEAGYACLLSPAAASYDAFKNFEERGTRFETLVRGYRDLKK